MRDSHLQSPKLDANCMHLPIFLWKLSTLDKHQLLNNYVIRSHGPGYFRVISSPSLKQFWYYSFYESPFRVRSLGEVALNCPDRPLTKLRGA